MADPATPELLDPAVDKKHHSFLSAEHQTELGVFRLRGPGELLTIDDRWKHKYFDTFIQNCHIIDVLPYH